MNKILFVIIIKNDTYNVALFFWKTDFNFLFILPQLIYAHEKSSIFHLHFSNSPNSKRNSLTNIWWWVTVCIIYFFFLLQAIDKVKPLGGPVKVSSISKFLDLSVAVKRYHLELGYILWEYASLFSCNIWFFLWVKIVYRKIF